MRMTRSFIRICTLLFALLMVTAMSNCPGPSGTDQSGDGTGHGTGGGMDGSGGDGGY